MSRITSGADLRRFRRTVAKMTQDEFGEALGYSQSHIANIERGHYDISDTFAWALHGRFPVLTVDLPGGPKLGPMDYKTAEAEPEQPHDSTPYIMACTVSFFLGVAIGVAMGVAL